MSEIFRGFIKTRTFGMMTAPYLSTIQGLLSFILSC